MGREKRGKKKKGFLNETTPEFSNLRVSQFSWKIKMETIIRVISICACEVLSKLKFESDRPGGFPALRRRPRFL